MSIVRRQKQLPEERNGTWLGGYNLNQPQIKRSRSARGSEARTFCTTGVKSEGALLGPVC